MFADGRQSGVGRHPANERLKTEWPVAFRISIIAATVFHTLIFALWPRFQVITLNSRELRVATLIPQVLMPALRVRPPDLIGVPALPHFSPVLNFETPDLSWSVAAFDASAAIELAPPTLAPSEESQRFRAFVPAVVAPQLLNREEVVRRVSRDYEWYLNRAYEAGETVVQIWLDIAGRVQKHEILRSSGDRSLDRIAKNAVAMMKFSPAVNLGQPTSITVTIPVSFRRISLSGAM